VCGKKWPKHQAKERVSKQESTADAFDTFVHHTACRARARLVFVLPFSGPRARAAGRVPRLPAGTPPFPSHPECDEAPPRVNQSRLPCLARRAGRIRKKTTLAAWRGRTSCGSSTTRLTTSYSPKWARGRRTTTEVRARQTWIGNGTTLHTRTRVPTRTKRQIQHFLRRTTREEREIISKRRFLGRDRRTGHFHLSL
jgi:hypothetical protein